MTTRLTEDQLQQLAALEAAGATVLTEWDRGALAALRMSASPAQAGRIDRLRGQHPAGGAESPVASLRTAEGQQQYQSLLQDAADRGTCPACGRPMPGGGS